MPKSIGIIKEVTNMKENKPRPLISAKKRYRVERKALGAVNGQTPLAKKARTNYPQELIDFGFTEAQIDSIILCKKGNEKIQAILDNLFEFDAQGWRVDQIVKFIKLKGAERSVESIFSMSGAFRLLGIKAEAIIIIASIQAGFKNFDAIYNNFWPLRNLGFSSKSILPICTRSDSLEVLDSVTHAYIDIRNMKKAKPSTVCSQPTPKPTEDDQPCSPTQKAPDDESTYQCSPTQKASADENSSTLQAAQKISQSQDTGICLLSPVDPEETLVPRFNYDDVRYLSSTPLGRRILFNAIRNTDHKITEVWPLLEPEVALPIKPKK